MSTSSAEPPTVSVVTAENGPGQLLVPAQWRDGIDAATGDLVYLTISIMRPAADWQETARRLAADASGVGGAIEPGDDLRLRDWAEYFCRYARDMLPFEMRETGEFAGDNAVYRREALGAVRDIYRDGFWELEVNRALREQGHRLVHSPELVVRQGRSAGLTAFVRQRLVHGRIFGRQRGARSSTARKLAGIPLAVVVPLVMIARTYREVFRRGRLRLRLIAASPLLLVYDVAWAVGEAAGYVDSLRGR
jgi:hypothetical protein